MNDVFSIIVNYFLDHPFIVREKRNMVTEAPVSLVKLVEGARCKVVWFAFRKNLRDFFFTKAYISTILRIHIDRHREVFSLVDG